MKNEQSRELLEKHRLRKTKIRLAVLDLFLQNKAALSNSEIEEGTGRAFDRVTVYRTLKAFETGGLIHKIPDETGSPKYALCTGCRAERHSDRHLHFSCTLCDRTFCLDKIPIPEIAAPENFTFTEFSFLARGICPDCLRK